jgi:hypothetical protein
MTVRVRPRHVIHVGLVLAVLIQLGFAGAFIADAAGANRTYDALAAHRVKVTARIIACAYYAPRPQGYGFSGRVCRVEYHYRNHKYSAVINYDQTRRYYVDPQDPTIAENVETFAGGPEEVGGDLTFAGLLLAGALLITSVHQWHLYRRRRARREFHAGSHHAAGTEHVTS